MKRSRLRHSWLMRMAKLARAGWRQIARRVALSRLFLLAAVVVVAAAMLVLGNWLGAYVAGSISRGVAETAASSIDALIANSLVEVGPGRPISAEARARLDAVFLLGNDSNTTRLLQIRIRDVDGAFIYESFGGIISDDHAADFAAAVDGKITSRVNDLPLEAVGPIESRPVSVLEIHTPIHALDTDTPFAVADLYYSAASIHRIQREAQVTVWLLVSMAGLAVIGALYAPVARVSRTIANQRANLARNLEASRRLADENQALHAASERLRVDAALSNEALLANVGSDLHDGPLQLLTLLILRLSKSARDAGGDPARAAALQDSVRLATDAMEELRSISSGLVLPELANVRLDEAVSLAVRRHEAVTGKAVRCELDGSAVAAAMTVKIGAYRIVQEALNNAYWHGDATAAMVSAAVSDGKLVVEVSNAAPTPLESAADNQNDESIGLRTMKFRAEALGGTLTFSMIPGEMAVITARIPLGDFVVQPASSLGMNAIVS